MAGTNPRFPADRFRTAIEFVQEMAAPPEHEERVHFYMPSGLVYVTPATHPESALDADGVPFDPNTTIQRTRPPPVTVPCSVTYFDAAGEIVNLGVVTPSSVAIDLLDVHYRTIEGVAFVAIHGDKYVYRRTEPPSGLFDVGIYTLHFDAENES